MRESWDIQKVAESVFNGARGAQCNKQGVEHHLTKKRDHGKKKQKTSVKGQSLNKKTLKGV